MVSAYHAITAPTASPGVDFHDLDEWVDGVGAAALERIAADDGAEPAAIADGSDLIQNRTVLPAIALHPLRNTSVGNCKT